MNPDPDDCQDYLCRDLCQSVLSQEPCHLLESRLRIRSEHHQWPHPSANIPRGLWEKMEWVTFLIILGMQIVLNYHFSSIMVTKSIINDISFQAEILIIGYNNTFLSSGRKQVKIALNLIQHNVKTRTKTHYWPFVKGIHRWLSYAFFIAILNDLK